MQIRAKITKMTVEDGFKVKLSLETVLTHEAIDALSVMVGYDALEVTFEDRRVALPFGEPAKEKTAKGG
uniref:Uncharacterized protein n=1 Tax=viral metagenome TaxID=1070528 RepID=A0A6H1ZZB9_9ZZZZ